MYTLKLLKPFNQKLYQGRVGSEGADGEKEELEREQDEGGDGVEGAAQRAEGNAIGKEYEQKDKCVRRKHDYQP